LGPVGGASANVLNRQFGQRVGLKGESLMGGAFANQTVDFRPTLDFRDRSGRIMPSGISCLIDLGAILGERFRGHHQPSDLPVGVGERRQNRVPAVEPTLSRGPEMAENLASRAPVPRGWAALVPAPKGRATSFFVTYWRHYFAFYVTYWFQNAPAIRPKPAKKQ
jgi:hypothetical protein